MDYKIINILDKIKDSAENPVITVSNYFGEDEEQIDNDCLLDPEECKQLLKYIESFYKETPPPKQKKKQRKNMVNIKMLD